MWRYFSVSFLTITIVFNSFVYSKNTVNSQLNNTRSKTTQRPIVLRYDVDVLNINPLSTCVVEDARLSSKKGLSLLPTIASALDGERTTPDLVFNINVTSAGRYVLTTSAITNHEGGIIMQQATSKFQSLFMRIQIDDQRPTKRVVTVPWGMKQQTIGKFDFTGKDQQIKIWLPRGVILDYMQLINYLPPKTPVLLQDYTPTVIPPAQHPRLWVNHHSLPQIKSRLEMSENANVWNDVKKAALKPFVFKFDPEKETTYNHSLERAAERKAFYYLMTNNAKIGNEAIRLMIDYLSVVEFGNILDISRELGRAIYCGSLVYDWCYYLMTVEEKQQLYSHLMRLADDMEIGWPPFKQTILTGHGSEMQLNRDLLSMSIAVYDEDPVPYQYTSFRVLEELVPMRNWQYQSGRHNQGVNYGAYRSATEMHAAWLFYRMTGEPVFDSSLQELSKYWLYMRLPDGQMLRDGDGFDAGRPGEFYYWREPLTMLMHYAYNDDPILKAEFYRQGGLPNNPIMFLLLNDPALLPEASLASMPLTIDFGPILGSMVARTGWDISPHSNDVVAEIKGGGYHFGNHQHCDAGAIQLYYRGFQVADLGLYGFYGTPYDVNFNKRSIAHSMMLARDPAERFANTASNDGGTRFNQKHPSTPKIAQSDPQFNNGQVESIAFGPSKLCPSFSYFAVDLVGAYSSKIEAYQRRFCFLNMEREDIPAIVILMDNMTTAEPEFKKYWQINTHHLPKVSNNGFILNNMRDERTGKTHVEMLIPTKDKRSLEILSGRDALNSFGFQCDVPSGSLSNQPEAHGHRIMISPSSANKHDQFLTVFQLSAGATVPLPVSYYETPVGYVVHVADRIVSMNKCNDLIDQGFSINVPEGAHQVLLTGMNHGDWNIKSNKDEVSFSARIVKGENSLFFVANQGEYLITPGQLFDAEDLKMD